MIDESQLSWPKWCIPTAGARIMLDIETLRPSSHRLRNIFGESQMTHWQNHAVDPFYEQMARR
ncbi:MAG TPA: hypothetical protein VN764_09600, partial [Polyangiaceae bacterium]|nr:hypothetical protein [Polyangiaceae bacterium]